MICSRVNIHLKRAFLLLINYIFIIIILVISFMLRQIILPNSDIHVTGKTGSVHVVINSPPNASGQRLAEKGIDNQETSFIGPRIWSQYLILFGFVVFV